MCCVGRVRVEGSIQSVGGAVVPYVEVSPDGVVRATEDVAGEGEDAIGI